MVSTLKKPICRLDFQINLHAKKYFAHILLQLYGLHIKRIINKEKSMEHFHVCCNKEVREMEKFVVSGKFQKKNIYRGNAQINKKRNDVNMWVEFI